uniref:Uncharacterized protein n=1 Tax=Chromera velia CCMP2878 TaxID=1169474 RepID=A0A0G4HSD5_9ALVE|eukprot:Cvel_8246.t1-p1 / transcript=Cvel_8246.t1 / gene=Cvel_8246 / organism=Chromera_velia_CCMP2878 / gene_product=Ankyrin repeat, PH and SEC7 domain containing, putative / transcript_product=Ankyrin repeat, PH and SEC7 domain containing, putative / location=Cvel_scaffold451:21536-27983(-) / protein_length=514 / sequence_SO=supercontig / SO=protein_coding / is_pseudo=false
MDVLSSLRRIPQFSYVESLWRSWQHPGGVGTGSDLESRRRPRALASDPVEEGGENSEGEEALDAHCRVVLLWDAVERGDAEGVKKLLRRKLTDVNKKNAEGKTALHIAVQRKPRQTSVEIVSALVAAGADAEAVDRDGRTSLHLASFYSSPPVVKVLLKREHVDKGLAETGLAKASSSAEYVDKADENGGMTALHLAVQRPDPSPLVVNVLLEAGARCDVLDSEGSTLLHFACRNGCVRLVRALQRAGSRFFNVNALDKEGNTAFRLAFRNPDLTTTPILSREREREREKAVEILKVLAEAGANVNIDRGMDESRETPLHLACELGNPSLVGALLKAGVHHLQWKNGNEKTALAVAVWKLEGKSGLEGEERPLWEIVMMLARQRGAGLNQVANKVGWWELHKAVVSKDLQLVESFVQRGVELQEVDERGRTVLHLAVLEKSPSVKIVKTLVKAGADTKARDQDGNTPLALAFQEGKSACVEVMRKDRWVDSKGRTLLQRKQKETSNYDKPIVEF